MYIRITTFRLDGPSHDEYEAQAVALAESFNDWPGLRAKLWIADEAAHRYGGIYLFDSAADAEASRSAPQFRSLEELPVFVDLSVQEFDLLAAPSAITDGGILASAAVA